MAAATPFAQLVGPCKVYLAPYGTAEPAVNTTPGASWVEFGPTTGDQNISKDAPNTYFYDNDHSGPVTNVTPQEDGTVTFTLVNMTHELVARVLHNVSQITTASTPNVSRIPFKSGFYSTRYALLVKGEADSPYGNYPGQWYFPMVVSEKSFEITRGKENRQELPCEFRVLEDDAQVDANRMGWSTVQTS